MTVLHIPVGILPDYYLLSETTPLIILMTDKSDWQNIGVYLIFSNAG